MRGRWWDERGQVGGLEALPFGVLVFVVGALLVANVWGVIDAKLAATAAAREATRAFVESPDEEQAEVDAAAAAAEAIEGHGRAPERLVLRRLEGSFRRCTRVTYEASYPVPAIALPWIGGFGHGFTARGRHSELVDPFRSGLPGRAACAG
jgi:hypothetical protein